MTMEPAGPVGHEALHWRHQITGRLVSETGCHVGAATSDSDPGAVDGPVLKDARGRPFLPGSSLRGALRSTLEALLRGLGSVRVCEPVDRVSSCSAQIDALRKQQPPTALPSAAGAFAQAWKESCCVCHLFGNTHMAGRVRVGDLGLVEQVAAEDAVGRRTGVGIDRDLRTAAPQVLYEFEAAEVGLAYALRLECENLEDHELGLLLVGLDLLGDGSVAVGGKSSRGLGRFRLEDLKVLRRAARDYIEGRPGAVLASIELEKARQAATDCYARREG